MPKDGSGSSKRSESPIISLRDFGRDVTFGSAAGMVSAVFEYPFDLAKVRLQSQSLSSSPKAMPFKGPMDCLKLTWREEGTRGLYRGFTVPLAGFTVETAVLFLAYTSCQNIIRKFSIMSPSEMRPSGNGNDLAIPQLGLASAGAGFLTSFIITPLELVKCKMQVQMMDLHTSPSSVPPIHPRKLASPLAPSTSVKTQTVSVPPPSTNPTLASDVSGRDMGRSQGPLGVVSTIVRSHGVKGLWLGHSATILRETGGTLCWFVVKEWTARAMRDRRLASISPAKRKLESTQVLTAWESGVSGALAGGLCVLALYPVDTVKSAMQTEEEYAGGKLGAKSGSASMWDMSKRMWRAHGLRGLYSGCGMTVLRAVPSSGIVFVVYDQLSAWIK